MRSNFNIKRRQTVRTAGAEQTERTLAALEAVTQHLRDVAACY